MANQLIEDILGGKLPDVPIAVKIDNESIVKIAVAAVIVVTICILVSKLFNRIK